MIKLSKKEVAAASSNAIILVEETNEGFEAFIVEREADGGIIHPKATENHMCYPVSMALEPGDQLVSGDWAVIPYVKGHPQGPALYGQDGISHKIEWKE